MPKPLLIIDPAPRTRAMIFTDVAWAELNERTELITWFKEGRMPDAMVEEHLPQAQIVIGQTHLSAERLARARHLKAVINVKGNWEPTLDYVACQARGIAVLSIAPAMAPAVAEASLGFAIDLARGITQADRDFRTAKERYGIQGNEQAYSLFNAVVGFIGYGNLGRALRPLLTPFGVQVLVYDPWLPDGYLAAQHCQATALDMVLQNAQFIFILAGVTAENQGFLTRERLALIRPQASVILVSRAEVVDFEALIEFAQAGRFRAAVDVFPEEPVAQDHPMRYAHNILWSAHRAGGIWPSYQRISEMMMDDIRQILNGLAPVRLQRAEPQQATLMRSR